MQRFQTPQHWQQHRQTQSKVSFPVLLEQPHSQLMSYSNVFLTTTQDSTPCSNTGYLQHQLLISWGQPSNREFWAANRPSSFKQNITSAWKAWGVANTTASQVGHCNKGKDWWILNNTFKVSNGMCSLTRRESSCNQIWPLTFIWKPESSQNHPAFYW